MKKIYWVVGLIGGGLLLAGCILPNNQSQTIGEKETQINEMTEAKSVDTIEKELKETEVPDFDKDVNALDQDINKL